MRRLSKVSKENLWAQCPCKAPEGHKYYGLRFMTPEFERPERWADRNPCKALEGHNFYGLRFKTPEFERPQRSADRKKKLYLWRCDQAGLMRRQISTVIAPTLTAPSISRNSAVYLHQWPAALVCNFASGELGTCPDLYFSDTVSADNVSADSWQTTSQPSQKAHLDLGSMLVPSVHSILARCNHFSGVSSRESHPHFLAHCPCTRSLR